MPTTPKYAFRYPAPTDPADGPLGYQNLAEDVEAALLGPAVASLPASPVNGQVTRYLVSANGPVWTLQYVSGSAAPYRWHFVGGATLYGRDQTSVNVGGGYPNMALLAPFVTVPLAGRYRIRYGCCGYYTAPAAITFSVTVTDPGPAAALDPATTAPPFVIGTNLGQYPASEYELTRTAPGKISCCQVAYTTGAGPTFERWLEVMPVVVG